MGKSQLNDINTRSPKIRRILGEAPPWIIRHGTLAVLVVFILLALMAIFVPVSDDGATIISYIIG